MKTPDILFIKPGSQKKLYGDLSDFELTAIEPPLWAALLAAFIRNQGYSIELLDAEVASMSPKETAEKAFAYGSILTVVVVSGTNPSASTMNMTGAGEIVRHIKELAPGMKTMFFGLHPSALPERTLQEESVDFVCQGEGFETLPSLLDALKGKTTNYNIPGLWYYQQDVIVHGPPPKPVEDLDALPMPAWDLLPMEKYRAHNWHCFGEIKNREPYAVLYTSLGCPYNCSFCCVSPMAGERGIRYRSLNKIIEELDYLVNEYGVKNIKIIDEMFALNEKRVIELCNSIASRGYDLNIWAYARVNTVSEVMLIAMKKAGINWLAYGFESGSSKVLSDVSKGYDPASVEKVVQMTRDNRIHICANFIFGLPEDDYETMNETLKLMLEINAEWVNIYSVMAFPGSELYQQALKEGQLLPDNWQAFSQYAYDTLPLSTKHLTGGQVLKFRDYAFDAYYRNPCYLSMLKSTFGKETMEHVINMSANQLERQHASI